MKSKQNTCHPRSQVSQLFLEFFSDLFLFSQSAFSAFHYHSILFQAQTKGGKCTVTCLNSLILCLLLTRKEKRSCLENMLSGAVEATAIRSSPNGHGWWLDNREAWDAQGGVSRFPTAGTCTGYSAATLTWMSLIWRRVRRQVIKMTGGGAPEQLLSSYSQVSPPPSIQLPRNGKRFS